MGRGKNAPGASVPYGTDSGKCSGGRCDGGRKVGQAAAEDPGRGLRCVLGALGGEALRQDHDPGDHRPCQRRPKHLLHALRHKGRSAARAVRRALRPHHRLRPRPDAHAWALSRRGKARLHILPYPGAPPGERRQHPQPSLRGEQRPLSEGLSERHQNGDSGAVFWEGRGGGEGTERHARGFSGQPHLRELHRDGALVAGERHGADAGGTGRLLPGRHGAAVRSPLLGEAFGVLPGCSRMDWNRWIRAEPPGSARPPAPKGT